MKLKMTYFFLIMFLLFAFLPAEEYEQKIERRFELAAGASLELSSINGEIGVSTTSGPAVEIKAVKKSDSKGEIENVEVIFETGKDALKVYVKYNKKNIKAKVDFIVAVPEKLARATFKSVNGPIGCQGKFTGLTLKTVNGKIDFQGRFSAGVFETVNGAIEITQEPLLDGSLRAEAVNGSITIELNRNSAFELAGQTVNGSIDNDFGVPVQRHLVGRTVSGKVNGGGHKLEIETVNGSIDISKI